MSVLGIIACRALEDELAHVLSEEREVRHLIIVDNQECFGLSGKLRSKNRPHLLASLENTPEMLNGIRRTSHGALTGTLIGMLKLLLEGISLYSLFEKAEDADEEMIIVVNVLKFALHIDNKLFRDEVCKNINAMSKFSDSILLFYGRCGNALQDIEVPQGRHCPLSFLTDDAGEIVDDCIAAAVGGNRQYAELLSSHPGVGFYFTPMWTTFLDFIHRELKRYTDENGLKPIGFGDVLTGFGYSKIARLDVGLKFISDYEVESKINWVADLYGLEVVKLYGDVRIAEKCYGQAKKNLRIQSKPNQDPSTLQGTDKGQIIKMKKCQSG